MSTDEYSKKLMLSLDSVRGLTQEALREIKAIADVMRRSIEASVENGAEDCSAHTYYYLLQMLSDKCDVTEDLLNSELHDYGFDIEDRLDKKYIESVRKIA